MANKRFFIGLLVLALVFGMTVIGCDSSGGGGGGGSSSGGSNSNRNPFSGTTWETTYEGGTLAISFSSSSYTFEDNSVTVDSGPYTYSGNTATFETSGTGKTTATISGNTLTVSSDYENFTLQKK